MWIQENTKNEMNKLRQDDDGWIAFNRMYCKQAINMPLSAQEYAKPLDDDFEEAVFVYNERVFGELNHCELVLSLVWGNGK